MIEMKTLVSNGTLLHKKDFTYRMTESEYFRYKQNWWISFNKSGDPPTSSPFPHFQGIHHRFVNDPEFRASQLEHDRDEEVCIKMDELAQKDFSHYMTQAEYFRCRRNWWISLKNDRIYGRLKNRSDFNEGLSTLHHLHQESGEPQLRPVLFWKYQHWHQSSSSSSSWWQWSDSWWSSL